jgi:hypothetical protein
MQDAAMVEARVEIRVLSPEIRSLTLVEKLCGKIAEESVLCCMQGRTTRSTSTFSESHSKFSMD